MSNFFSFWCQCTKWAASGAVPLTRIWWWFLGIPAGAALHYLTPGWGIEMILPNHPVLSPIVDGMLFTVAAFLTICIGSFLFRLLTAPVDLYSQQRNRADSLNHELTDRRTPKMRVSLDSATGGVIEAPTEYISNGHSATGPLSKWVQVNVECATASPINNCEAWLTSVKRLDDKSEKELVEENVRCMWSQRDDTTITLHPGVVQRFNLFSLYERGEKWTAWTPIRPETRPVKLTLRDEIRTPGKYQVKITVVAKGAEPVPRTFVFNWDDFDHVSIAPGNE